MKLTILFLTLAANSSFGSSVMHCLNFGKTDGFLEIIRDDSQMQYYNGEITITGNAIHEHFEKTLNSIQNKKCGYYFQKTCSLKARVEEDFTAILAGRFEPGFEVYQDYGGMKLISTFDGKPTGEEWWFENCTKI